MEVAPAPVPAPVPVPVPARVCIVCLNTSGVVSDYNQYYKCECNGVSFHDECWKQYDMDEKRCPLCRKEHMNIMFVRSEGSSCPVNTEVLVPVFPVPEIEPDEVQDDQDQNQPGELHPSIPPPCPSFVMSRFITEHPILNAIFSFTVVIYAYTITALFGWELFCNYSQLDSFNVAYSIIFVMFNIYDSFSVIIDQWFGVLYFIQAVLATRRRYMLWLGIYYMLIFIRIILSLSCAVLTPFLSTNNNMRFGYIMVTFQGISLGIVCCNYVCCKLRH